MPTKVKVKLSNRTAFLTSRYPYDVLVKHWSYTPDSFVHMLRLRPWYKKCKECGKYPNTKTNRKKHNDKDHDYVPIWDGRRKFLKQDMVPAGLFLATYKEIEKKEKIRFKILDRKEYPYQKRWTEWLESEGKYKFQNDCVEQAYDKISKGEGGLILNATGSGKTRIAAMIASRFSCEILFVVDQLTLLRQAREEISKHLKEKVGYVGESKFILERVTVATIQTLALHINDMKFLRWFRRVKIEIIDEIHDQMNRSNFAVVRKANPLSVIGLTATLALSKKPVRLKAYSLTGPVLYKYPVKTGMEEGVLSKGICIQLVYKNSLHNIEGWDNVEAYNTRIVNNSERNHLITRLIRQNIRKGKYVIVGVERLKHLEEISERLKYVNIKHKVVSGSYKGKGIKVSKRMRHKDRFEAGEIRCLVVNKVFKKGIDIKRVDVIINATGRPNQNDVLQFFGRGLRIHKDKKGLTYYDIYDFDPEDSLRKKKNWLHTAAKKRIAALKKAGIYIHKENVDDNFNTRLLIRKANKLLKGEV